MKFFARVLVLLFVPVLIAGPVKAQLCQGSLGDPIINITFGSGSNPGAPLLAATTSYQFVSNDCPNDGFYTLRNNTTNCFANSWHSLPSDHTGDAGGYFMLVNASFQPSAFYLDTVKGLCGGTTYEFAAWVANVLKTSACQPNPTQPNLTFTLERTDGTVLQTYNTNTINSQSTPIWQQFGFFFATPPNVSDVVVRIFNNAPGGCGNDLALDDITFRPCGPKISASIVSINVDTAVICQGNAGNFSFTSTISAGFTNPAFQWQESLDGVNWIDIPGAVTGNYSRNFPAATPTGKYRFRLSAAEAGNFGTLQCRIASEALMIHVAPIPLTQTGNNSPVCENQSLSFSVSGASQYQWTGPNNFTATGAVVRIDNATPNQSGKYYVLATSAEGCTHLDSVQGLVNPNPVAGVAFADARICEGDNIPLQSSGGGTYEWFPSTGLSSTSISNPIASPGETTTYTVVISNQFTCTDTATVLVNVLEVPTADAGEDKWIIEGNSVQLNATVTGENVTYVWSPASYINDVLSLQPFINPPRDTTYVLSVTSNDGCGEAVDSMHVYVYKDIYIPSAFSPNNDGLNDTWNIPTLSAFPQFELTVFNRAGQVVYQSRNSNVPWNGRYKGALQPVGVYVYFLDLKVEGGKFKGTVTLIR